MENPCFSHAPCIVPMFLVPFIMSDVQHHTLFCPDTQQSLLSPFLIPDVPCSLEHAARDTGSGIDAGHYPKGFHIPITHTFRDCTASSTCMSTGERSVFPSLSSSYKMLELTILENWSPLWPSKYTALKSGQMDTGWFLGLRNSAVL